MYLFSYIALAVFSSYISIYLMDIGSSGSEVGFVVSCSFVLSMITQPFIGILNDKYHDQINELLLIIAGILGIVFIYLHNILLIGLIYGLVLAIINGITPMLEKKATTPIIVEQYQTQLEMARERVKGLKQQQNAAFSSVTEVGQRQENAEAAVMRAEAAVEMARLNLSYTVVLAPCDGYLGRRSMEEGQLVGAGQTVTTIIPETRKWIVANYKETQIASLSVGQEVEVTVDAFKGKIFRGRITAISSATGSKYSMIPTDNLAGNFVKIQQRVPVRIDLDISPEDNRKLAAGMMCVVKANL